MNIKLEGASDLVEVEAVIQSKDIARMQPEG